MNLLNSIKKDVKTVKGRLHELGLRVSDKSRFMTFSIKDCNPRLTTPDAIEYEQTNIYKYLGVTFDSNLKWNLHIEELTKKVKTDLRALYLLNVNVPTKYVRTAYFAYIQTKLIYGVTVWGGATKNLLDKLSKAIDRVAKRIGCVRTVSSLYRWRLLKSLCKIQSPRPVRRNPRQQTSDKLMIRKFRTEFRTRQYPVNAEIAFNRLTSEDRRAYFERPKSFLSRLRCL